MHGAKGTFFFGTMAIKTALLPLFLGASSGISQNLSDTQINATIPQLTPLTYYSHHWRNSLRALNHDSADLIGLPFPYATPTLKGNQLFQEMYYWDSYFINRGLLAYGTHPQRSGESTADELAAVQQAIHNVNNLLFLVKKLGFVPNANRYSMTNRSQPPLLGAMVADLYRATRDTAWLRQALPILEKEHDWWMQARSLGLSQREQTIAPNALAYNHYGHNASNAFLLRFGRFLSGRLDEGFDSLLRRENQDSLLLPAETGVPASKQGKGILLLGHLLAEAESGWDFTPRFNARCQNMAALDLNCLLYITENTLFEGYKSLRNPQKAKYCKSVAKKRKELINKLFYDKHTGWYWDYDIAMGKISTVNSAAQFMPYFANIAPHTHKHTKALLSLSELFIGRYGVHPCLPVLADSIQQSKNRVWWSTQWNSPNAWPPLTHFVAQGLLHYSDQPFQSKTQRALAEKRYALIQGFLQSVETQFILTGKFWEKYNLHTGALDVTNEYAMPDFFGWTAGVYVEYHLEFVGP